MTTPTPRVAQHLSDELERAARLFCSGGPLHPQLPAGWEQIFKEAAKALRLVPFERDEARTGEEAALSGQERMGEKLAEVRLELEGVRAELAMTQRQMTEAVEQNQALRVELERERLYASRRWSRHD